MSYYNSFNFSQISYLSASSLNCLCVYDVLNVRLGTRMMQEGLS